MNLVGQQTFLQLCQAVFREGGISGSISTTVGQTGEALRVVSWVQDAYLEIINREGLVWNFVRGSAQVQLIPGQGIYTFDDFNLPSGVMWDVNSMRVAGSPSMADETFLIGQRFPDFRNYRLFGSRRTVISRPLNCSIDDQTNLRAAPLPDMPYYAVLQYESMPPALSLDTDVPFWPPRYHNAVMWRALRSYGMFEQAPEVVGRADKMLREMMVGLRMNQAYQIIVGQPIC